MTFAKALKIFVSLNLVTAPLAYAGPSETDAPNLQEPTTAYQMLQDSANQDLDAAAKENLLKFNADYRALSLGDKARVILSLERQMADVRLELDRKLLQANLAVIVPNDDTTIELSNALLTIGLTTLATSAALGVFNHVASKMSYVELAEFQFSRSQKIVLGLGGNSSREVATLLRGIAIIGVGVTLFGMVANIQNGRKIKVKDAVAFRDALVSNAAKLDLLRRKYAAIEAAAH